MTQGFFVNSADCYGCKSCQVACANEKLLTPGVFIRRVRQINAAGTWRPRLRVYGLQPL